MKDCKDSIPNLSRYIGMKVVEINEMHPTLSFYNGGFLTIECSWRLRNADYILIGSYEFDSEKTHTDTFKKLTDLLIGKEITNIYFVPPVSDLAINFNKELTLELFSNSGIYENWTLSDGKGNEVISLIAGDYCCFVQSN